MAKWRKISCATYSRLSKVPGAQMEEKGILGLRKTFRDGKTQCYRMVSRK